MMIIKIIIIITIMINNKNPSILWSRGKYPVWDATCMDIFYPSKLQHSSELEVSGGAAAIAKEAKNFKYVHLYPAYQIQPIAVETCGTVQICLKVLERRRLRMAYGEPKSYVFLLQRLAVAVQTGNAASDTGSIPVSLEYFDHFRCPVSRLYSCYHYYFYSKCRWGLFHNISYNPS